MYLINTLILYAFVTVLVSVRCQEFTHEETNYHTYEDSRDCPKREITANRRSGSLMPRERLVTLKAKSGFEFFPRSVSAKRCNGHCPNNLSPMPTMLKPKNFTVHLHQEGNPMPLKCVTVTVQEHAACRCMCMVTAEDCTELQEYDEPSCNCRCKERGVKKAACEGTPGMEWHDKDCSCVCPDSIMHCPPGQIWSKDVCACV